jgi:acetyl-CoA acetyltransferase
MMPQQIAHYLGITPKWVDGTGVGGCSFMLHVRHAAAAIHAGYAKTILITHGESGKSRINAGGARRNRRACRASSRCPLRPDGPAHAVHPSRCCAT